MHTEWFLKALERPVEGILSLNLATWVQEGRKREKQCEPHLPEMPYIKATTDPAISEEKVLLTFSKSRFSEIQQGIIQW